MLKNKVSFIVNSYLLRGMSSTVTENGNMLKLTPDRLSLEEVTSFVTDPSAGGISIFMGESIHSEMWAVDYPFVYLQPYHTEHGPHDPMHDYA